EAAQASLDLSQGPLLRVLLADLADGSQRLLLAIHHLVVDGVSWRVLLEDLQSAYEQAQAGPVITLPPKTASYKDWALALQGAAAGWDDELAHWQALAQALAQTAGTQPPADTALAATVGDAARVEFTLDTAETEALLKAAPAAYRTQVNDLLLTALARALSTLQGQQAVLVELEGHGREDLFARIDLSRTVGWFTSVYPVLLDAAGDMGAAIRRVKETLRAVPRRGLGHGVLARLGSPEQRGAMAVMPRASVQFNYLGRFDGSFTAASSWRPAAESPGATRDARAPLAHDLVVNGSVYEGRLSMVLDYSTRRYGAQQMQVFAQAYRQALHDVLAHCQGGPLGVTPSDFPLAGLTQEQLDQLPVAAADVQDLYPLAPMQQGMLFHSLYDAAGAAYINQFRVDILGLDVPRFRAAWQAAVDRHDILRTGMLNSETPLQWVAREVALPLTELDWRGHAEAAAELDRYARADRATPFDLATPPLTRLTLVRTGEDAHHLIWTMHHLLLDGWSTSRLLGEVLRRYAQPDAAGAAPVQAPYRDYIAWLRTRDETAAREYWQALLSGMESPSLIADALALVESSGRHEEHVRVLSAETTEALAAFARTRRVTLNTVLQGAWALLLQRYTGASPICFGSTTAGRPAELPGIEQALGLFINTLPVVATVQPEQDLAEWLQALQGQSTASREHEHTPLHQIQRWTQAGAAGLFDTLIVFENFPVDEALRQSGETLRFSGVRSESDNHYPLTLRVQEQGTLRLDFLHDPGQIGPAAIQRCAALLEGLLQTLAALPQGQTIRLADLMETGRAVSLEAVPPASGVLSRWSDAVAAGPERLAVAGEDGDLSYAGLDRASTALAARLRDAGVGLEDRVAVHAPRSAALAVGLLGALKAGGVYVPLDPALPAERLAYVVRDSQARCVVSSAPLEWDPGVPVVLLEGDLASAAEGEAVHEAVDAPAEHPSQAAYLIYTSGSTGQPKGVVVSHGALANYVAGALARMDLPEDARSMAMVSTVAADLGHTMLFGALCSGRALHMIPA
ncbi:condensation domain-containing protein, partial [Achromobacter sp. Root83]|uniref:condensation domain-containing protein n=1 Tax=Achromobacter sp. Root83 TaxID=1736602 RepID=UPI000A75EB6C